MTIESNQSSSPTLKIGRMRLKTIVAEVTDKNALKLNLKTESGIQGLIVLFKPALPSIE